MAGSVTLSFGARLTYHMDVSLHCGLNIVLGVGLTACSGTVQPSPAGAPRAATVSAEAEPACPSEPEGAKSYADGLVHLGRAEGDRFIEILDVVVRGKHVFSCTGTQGLTVWDTTDPAAARLVVEGVGPKGISHPKFPRCQRAALDEPGTRLVMTNRGDEIQPTPFLALYDISSLVAPKAIATWTGSASIESAAFSGDRIVAAAHTDGLMVLERRGKKLRKVGSFKDGQSDAWHLELRGDLAFVAEGQQGLRVYRLDETTPKLVGSLDLPGSSKDLAISDDGKTVYLPTSDGLAIVDVKDPTQPVLLSHTETPGTALAVATGAPGFVFIADWGEVRGYDVRDPKSPVATVSDRVPTEAEISRVLTLEATADGRVYAGEWEGMHVFEHAPDAVAPELVIEGGPLQFGRVSMGSSAKKRLWLNNTGRAPLAVTNITGGSDVVRVDPSCASVPPGGQVAVDVTWAPTDSAPLLGTVRVSSDDPDERDVGVRVVGNLDGLGVGDAAPKIAAVDLDGTVWDNKRLEGNIVVLAYFATF